MPHAISFAVDREQQLRGQPRYVLDDHAFDFETETPMFDPDSFASLTADTLQLNFHVETGRCLYLWGYCPLRSVVRKPLVAPTSTAAGLRADVVPPLSRGDGLAIPTIEAGLRAFDSKSGWFCVGDPDGSGEIAVEFASASIAVVRNTNLVAIWIRPANWRELGV